MPLVSVGTSDLQTFMNLPIELNHNDAGAEYQIKKEVPVEFSKPFVREKQTKRPKKPQSRSKFALANFPLSVDAFPTMLPISNVGANAPDTMSRTPKRKIRRKTSNIEDSPGNSNLTTSGAPSGAGASTEKVLPPPLQENEDDRKEPATARGKKRTATATNSSWKRRKVLQSPAGTCSLMQPLPGDSEDEEEA